MNEHVEFLNPEYLNIFCQVALAMQNDHSKSLAQHAEDLGVSESKVNRAMRHVSSYFNQPVIQKGTGHGKKLTPAGQHLYEQAADYQRSVVRLSADAHALTVGACPVLLSDLLPEAIQRFLFEHGWQGRVLLRLRVLDHLDVKRQVLNGRMDFAIGWNIVNERSSFMRDIQPPFYMGLITPPDHPLAKCERQSVNLREIQRPGQLLWTLPDELLFPALLSMVRGHPVNWRVTCPTYAAIVGNVRRGNGVGIVPLWRWRLERLRETTGLFYARLEGVLPHYLTAYLPPGRDAENGSVARLSEPAQVFFRIVQELVCELGERGPAKDVG